MAQVGHTQVLPPVGPHQQAVTGNGAGIGFAVVCRPHQCAAGGSRIDAGEIGRIKMVQRCPIGRLQMARGAQAQLARQGPTTGKTQFLLAETASRQLQLPAIRQPMGIGNDVDHTGDRVGAIQRRCRSEHKLHLAGAVQGQVLRHREIAAGGVSDANPVEHHQQFVRAHVALHHKLVVLRRFGAPLEIHARHVLQQIGQIAVAPFADLLLRDHHNMRGCLVA